MNGMTHLYKEDQHSTIQNDQKFLPSLVGIKSRWDLKFSGGAWSINYKTVFIFGGNEIKWWWISSSADIWSSLPWRSSRALPSRWGGQGPVGCCNGLDPSCSTPSPPSQHSHHLQCSHNSILDPLYTGYHHLKTISTCFVSITKHSAVRLRIRHCAVCDVTMNTNIMWLRTKPCALQNITLCACESNPVHVRCKM